MVELTQEEITSIMKRYFEKHPLPDGLLKEPYTVECRASLDEIGVVTYVEKLHDTIIVELVQRLEALESDRDEWKAKAEAAGKVLEWISETCDVKENNNENS